MAADQPASGLSGPGGTRRRFNPLMAAVAGCSLVVLGSIAFMECLQQPTFSTKAGLGCYPQCWKMGIHTDSEIKVIEQARKKAEQGDPEAQLDIAEFDLRHGENADAMRLIQASAEQGYARAENNLASFYEHGSHGVPQNYDEALRWQRRAADHGSPQAAYRLALRYAKGSGVPQDQAEARRWMEKAAASDWEKAQCWLMNAPPSSDPSPPIEEVLARARRAKRAQHSCEGFRMYRIAAEQGNAEGQTELASLYLNGGWISENEILPKDPAQALLWYRKAAEQGFAEAERRIAFMYADGKAPLERDVVQTRRWLQRAAEHGDAGAQIVLSRYFRDGLGGEQNLSEAERWLRKAVEHDKYDAPYRLGLFLAEGRGGLANLDEARVWMQKAAAAGNGEAGIWLARHK